ncbi:Eco57I restriction-modification methylase domain-containing protein [Ellagibacter isourolithinifaciens]|uniref:Eco57I restriction-modification methylase domain-containing protein n=1 Tax=Ellagibacter isourolithinifaciens TaxID=2137581 RepID=UPI003AAA8C62
MKFDFAIGNPPYQEETENNGRQNPVYNKFMDEAYKIADCVELITPARFLFNAGQTPKDWNRRMLSDEHLKVMLYEPDASSVFSGTEIKGGVAITLRDSSKSFGEIGVFTKYAALNDILKKVWQVAPDSLMDICIGAVPYKYTNKLREDFPDYALLAGDSFDLRTNSLDKLAGKVFFDSKPDGYESILVYGIHNRARACMWINKDYVEGPKNFEKYKLLISKACGAGQFGETLPEAILAGPGIGHTQSFVSIGIFDTELEARNLECYMKTKFCRCMLGILKATQDITPSKWAYVPLQDFSPSSDIDWLKTISGIDQQLYAKYGLSPEEIEFIETHVKEMS